MKDSYNNAVGPQVRRRKSGPGSIVPTLALLSLVGGLQTATQYFARDFSYQATLGSHVDRIYPPWAIVRWASKWYVHYPDAFMRAGSFGILAAGVALLVLAIVRMLVANSSRANEYLHGSARWANIDDIRAAGLLPKKQSPWRRFTGRVPAVHAGVYVGAWIDPKGRLHYLRHDGPEHIATYAPTRSGKGLGLVIPTLLSWPHSAVITDLKGELWEITAGWRQRHAKNKVLRFEPAASNGGVCWNPLDEIRVGTEHEVGDVQNVATLVVDPDGKGLETHWQKTSRSLIVGLILHALYKSKADGTVATLPGIDAMMSDPKRAIGELWMEMITFGHISGQNHPVVGAAARDMMDRPEEEAGSVLSTAKSYLDLYRDPVVARNVSRSDFRIKDLMNHDSPVSLYIVTQPTDKARLRPLVRVMMNMIVRLLADRMEFERVGAGLSWWGRVKRMVGFSSSGGELHVRTKKAYKHRLLAMVDEFPSLGKLSILQESLSYVAGYGIKFYLICQDINQLKSREEGYGPDETITSGCHVQNAFPPNRLETAEHLSKLCGQTTVVKEQFTTSGKRVSPLLGQVSYTQQEVQRPLLTTDECLRMPGPRKEGELIVAPGDMVVYVAGFPAIYGRQPLFFQDPIFTARAAIAAPKQCDRLRNIYASEPGEGIRL
jgi:type IV secretion system protein VirD4